MNPSAGIPFLLNNAEVQPNLPPGTVLLDFLREHRRLVGTKIGCREGDCGACTVLIGEAAGDSVSYRSMTSCLVPLGNVQGKHVVTIEGLNLEQLSPVQHAVVEEGGTQCGFCTVGFVVSLTGLCLRPQPPTPEATVAAMDGNICRCTGYKSLERAGERIVQALTQSKTTPGNIPALVGGGFLPGYFTEVPARLKRLSGEVSGLEHRAGRVVGGGTDLYVQRPDSMPHAPVSLVFDRPELKTLSESASHVRVGGAVTTQELLESPVLQKHVPHLSRHLKLVSSTPIRNMATVAGNFANASPIGDLSILFLALESVLELEGPRGVRALPLKHFFLNYKKTDMEPEELVTGLTFPVLEAGAVFNFEKVSKRTHLDIASVNSAARILAENGVVRRAALSAGGVAPVPKDLAGTADFLVGREVSAQTVREAVAVAQSEIAPISDARGSADYKRLLLRQLLYAHFLEGFPQRVRFEELL